MQSLEVIGLKKLALFLALLSITLGSSGCHDQAESTGKGVTLDGRAQSELQAAQALAKNPQEILRRIYGAEVEVPGTGVRVHLAEGRAQGPGEPPAWYVELRHVAGTVPSGSGLDVFVDLAIHRALKAPDCYLVLFRLSSTATNLSSALSMGEGTRVVEAKKRRANGNTYSVEVEYLERAPQGDFLSNPSMRKRRLIEITEHTLPTSNPPPATAHP